MTSARARSRGSVWGLVLLAVSAVYLWPFVARGWIPHDEGTFAGDAVRVLAGEVPHRDFHEPYTGGLTWAYAALFAAFGTDLVVLRWAMFAGALAAVACWYGIARAWLPPVGAALVAAACLTWSFPNYFSAAPSWWVLVCASASCLAFVHYLRGRDERWLVPCGVMLGLAVACKQTALYLAPPLWLALAFDERLARTPGAGARFGASLGIRLLAFAAIVAGLSGVLSLSFSMSAVMLFVWPAVLVSAVPVAADAARSAGTGVADTVGLLRRAGLIAAGAVVPMAAVVGAFAVEGAARAFFEGAFLLPRVRGTAAAFTPGDVTLLVALVGYLFGTYQVLTSSRGPAPLPAAVSWAPLVAVIAVGWTVIGHRFVWNAVRFSLLVIAPLTVALVTRPDRDRATSSMAVLLVGAGAFLALFQFPLPFPIYFCFAAPLVLLAASLALWMAGVGPVPQARILAALAIFGLGMNLGYADTVGLRPTVVRFDTPLNLPRASLTVDGRDRETYARVVELVRRHSGDASLHAFPDCPEIYFLAERRNPTPITFDFFQPMSDADLTALWRRQAIDAVVINHTPGYSRPPSADTLAVARRHFPKGERAGRFEVRWR